MRFEVTALSASGAETRLALDAADEAAARGEARRLGYAIVRVSTERPGAWRRSAFPLAGFAAELATLLEAGLTITESLETLAEKQAGADARSVIAALLEALRSGRSLSVAVESLPEVFPPLFAAVIRSSERGGGLAPALSRYVQYQGRVDELRSKLLTASIYPAMLLGVGTLVTLFLLGYVLPRFSAVYADLGREPPWLSRVLGTLGAAIAEHGALAALLLLALSATAGIAARRPSLRARLAALPARLPGLGPMLVVMRLSRFYRTVSMLLAGGEPAVRALLLARGLLEPAGGPALDRALAQVRAGQSMSKALEAEGLATPVAARLLRVGERSGDMAAMMERIAVFHDAEIARALDRATRLAEPLLMLAIGLVVGALVVVLYMPVFDLASGLE